MHKAVASAEVCRERALVAEVASMILIVLSVAIVVTSLWPSQGLDQELTRYIQSSVYTTALGDNVRILKFTLQLLSVAVGVYFFRLFLSLYSFDALKRYCETWLRDLPRGFRVTEWGLRLTIMLLLLVGLDHGFGPVLSVEHWPPPFIGEQLALMTGSGIDELRLMAEALSFISWVLLALLIWSVVVFVGLAVSAPMKVLGWLPEWFWRFVVGPLLLATFVFVEVSLLAEPGGIASQPSTYFWPPLLAGLIIAVNLYGLIGGRALARISFGRLKFSGSSLMGEYRRIVLRRFPSALGYRQGCNGCVAEDCNAPRL